MEHRLLYQNTGVVPLDSYEVKLGQARILTAGTDITIVAISHMVVEALRAKHLLEQVGISAEVIDPVSLAPLDIDTIVSSVRKTGKLLIVDTSWTTCGATAEIACQVFEALQSEMKINVKRLGYENTPCPTTRSLEDIYYPSSHSIALEAHKIMGGKESWMPVEQVSREIEEFRGPF